MTSSELRTFFERHNNLTTISKDTFEAHFTKTVERIEFTFGGWDGKSYGGETRMARVLRIDIPGFESKKFIKVGKGIHMITEQHMMLELATGISHPTVSWVMDVARS